MRRMGPKMPLLTMIVLKKSPVIIGRVSHQTAPKKTRIETVFTIIFIVLPFIVFFIRRAGKTACLVKVGRRRVLLKIKKLEDGLADKGESSLYRTSSVILKFFGV